MPRPATIITATAIITTITTMTEDALFDLLTWTSPAWPIGAFAFSSGLEWAVEAGQVSDRASTEAWLADLIDQGPIRNDAVSFVHAWRAAVAGDAERLDEVAALAMAMLGSRERRLEASAQGAAFRRIALAAAPAREEGGGTAYGALLAGIEDGALAYPVAAAALFAAQAVPLPAALTAFLHGVVANLVSAAQRLVPLGQTDAQLVLRALRAPILATAARAETLGDGDPFDAMGSFCLSAELAAIAHETQYTRLFRT